jgi:multiple sugar transport system permease protein
MRRFLPHIGLIVFAIYILLPALWVLRTSIIPDGQSYSTDIFPQFTLENYSKVLFERKFGSALLNSLILAGGSTLLALPFAAMVAYAFARYSTGGKTSRFLVLATQMLPAIVLILPVFTVFRGIGLTNNLLGLVLVYSALNLPFLTWILLGFFEGLPQDLESAAMIDGATPVQTFIRIVLPLSAPGIVSAGILGFIMAWNEFIFALVLSGPRTATVPVALAAFQSQNGVQIANVSAGVVLAVLPMAIISRFVQKYIVSGLTFGAVK